jgi:glycerol kinase
MPILAIDQGTSSTKALVVDDDGRVLAACTTDVSPRALGNGAVEQSPNEVWSSVVTAGQAAIAQANVPIDAIGVGNQGETVLDWDPTSGTPFGPAISWQDSRATEITDKLGEFKRALEEISGLPLDPYFAAPKMTWLQRHRGRQGLITTLDAWIAHQLTGEIVTDAATASRTMLLDLAAAKWSDRASEIFDIATSEVRVVGCSEPIGVTTAFGESLPVTALIVDQQAALLGQSCLQRAEAKCTYGTGAFLLANAGHTPIHSRNGLAASIAWQIGSETIYCLDGQVFTAGAAVAWLSRLGLLRDASDIDPMLAQHAPLDCQAPIFVPALAGLGAPQWLPSAGGMWRDLFLATTREDLVAAVIGGIAAQVAVLAQAIGEDLGSPLSSLRVDGGLTRCATLMQAQADLLGVPVECYPGAHATALGIAALARVGVGQATTPEQALGRASPERVYEPKISPDQAQASLDRFDAAAQTAGRQPT